MIDGHTFKAKVRHPIHGQPFAPEVTVFLDAATRKITGWSVSLSENTIGVGDAVRHAVGTHGVPALVYSDNGAGETAKALDCPVAGLFARLGAEHRTGIPGHPQGHGLIERSWRTHMIRCARQFGSYQGSDADGGSVRAARLEFAREKTALKRAEQTGDVVQLSPKAPSWPQFMQAVAKAVDDYNTLHRHRGLPRHVSGPHAGKRMTPAEAWDAWLVPEDQDIPDAATLRHLFMPAVLRTAERGWAVHRRLLQRQLMHRGGRPPGARALRHRRVARAVDTGGRFCLRPAPTNHGLLPRGGHRARPPHPRRGHRQARQSDRHRSRLCPSWMQPSPMLPSSTCRRPALRRR